MAWKELSVSEQRLLMVNLIDEGREPVAALCRRLGVSRKTAYKWLARWRADPGKSRRAGNRSRRPRSSPRRTGATLETRALAVRDEQLWGARKIRAALKRQGLAVPSINTVNRVLDRHGRLTPPPQELPGATQRFERSKPNELWQLDHKGPIEIGRQRRHPLTVMDDHSRYLLLIEPCPDLTTTRVWALLWGLFGEVGLPEAILCDNAFAVRQAMPGTLTRFEANLIRLGIKPIHGRPYHPQTQGKVERLHSTFEREMYPAVRTGDDDAFRQDTLRWRQSYNRDRPHEALGDESPMTRWHPSDRPRPEQLPPVAYDAGATLRRVSKRGDLSWQNRRIVVGEGLAGEAVRIEETQAQLCVYYSWKQVRAIPLNALARAKGREHL